MRVTKTTNEIDQVTTLEIDQGSEMNTNESDRVTKMTTLGIDQGSEVHYNPN